MNLNKVLTIAFLTSFVYSVCGGCATDVNKSKAVKPESFSNQMIISVPNDGKINGLVVASCGTCNLGAKGKGCNLYVKIGESVFPVKGTSIHDHGNAHGKEGFCLMARAAWVKGEIKDNILHVDMMKLVSH